MKWHLFSNPSIYRKNILKYNTTQKSSNFWDPGPQKKINWCSTSPRQFLQESPYNDWVWEGLTVADLEAWGLGLSWSGESGSWISDGGWMLMFPVEVASSCSVSSEWPSSGAAFSVILSSPSNTHNAIWLTVVSYWGI